MDYRCAIGFQWDRHNQHKNKSKHGVDAAECEEVFFNQPLLVSDDAKHSQNEDRQYVLGRTDDGRRLFLVFTIREKLIRVISARDQNKKERQIYENENTTI